MSVDKQEIINLSIFLSLFLADFFFSMTSFLFLFNIGERLSLCYPSNFVLISKCICQRLSLIGMAGRNVITWECKMCVICTLSCTYFFLPSSFVPRLGLTKRCNKLMACRCCCTPFLYAVALCCIHAQKNRKGKKWMLCYVYFVTPRNAVQCNAMLATTVTSQVNGSKTRRHATQKLKPNPVLFTYLLSRECSVRDHLNVRLSKSHATIRMRYHTFL